MHLLDQVERREGVGPHDVDPFAHGYVRDGGGDIARDAGVDEQQVERAGCGSRGERIDRVRVGDVEPLDGHFGDIAQPGLAGIVADGAGDAPALPRIFAGQRVPEPARRTDDQDMRFFGNHEHLDMRLEWQAAGSLRCRRP